MTLVALGGTWKEKKLDLAGFGTRGAVHLDGEAKDGKFEGRLVLGKTEVKFKASARARNCRSHRAAKCAATRATTRRKRSPRASPRCPAPTKSSNRSGARCTAPRRSWSPSIARMRS